MAPEDQTTLDTLQQLDTSRPQIDPVPPTAPPPVVPQPHEVMADRIKNGDTVESLLSEGAKLEDVVAGLHEIRRADSLVKGRSLKAAPARADNDWQEHEAWLHDGIEVYGELKEFVWPAYRAGKAGNQAEFAYQKDLLYKAVLTFIGPPPALE